MKEKICTFWYFNMTSRLLEHYFQFSETSGKKLENINSFTFIRLTEWTLQFREFIVSELENLDMTQCLPEYYFRTHVGEKWKIPIFFLYSPYRMPLTIWNIPSLSSWGIENMLSEIFNYFTEWKFLLLTLWTFVTCWSSLVALHKVQ